MDLLAALPCCWQLPSVGNAHCQQMAVASNYHYLSIRAIGFATLPYCWQSGMRDALDMPVCADMNVQRRR
jgi:hypothetical protein